jgi:ribosomal protein L31
MNISAHFARSASRPFYTGKETVLDVAGRVDKFKKRQAASKK